MKWRSVGWMIFMIVGWLVYSQWPDGKLHVVFCDVGEGDASIIIMNNVQIVVDTGPSFEKFDKCLTNHIPFWDRQIEAVILSHGHADHAGALGEVQRRYQVKKLLKQMKTNDVVRYGNLHIDILKGTEPQTNVLLLGSDTENERANIMRFSGDGLSVLFTADMDTEAELALIDSRVLEQTDVLKVAHHGSKFASSEVFLRRVKPKIGVVSVGAKNTYGHPNGDTLIRLDGVGAKVLRTDKEGTVEFVSDGIKTQVITER